LKTEEWNGFKEELNKRLGWNLEPTKDFNFESTTDRYGWSEDSDGHWTYGLFVEGGRLRGKAKEGVRLIAEKIDCEFRLTANQNLVIARVSPESKLEIDKILTEYNVTDSLSLSALRLNSIACTGTAHMQFSPCRE
jgi:sulfite reductase (NADPH) hemoprotein beta-component